MEYKVDYHMHSYFSDGLMSPMELVQKYHEEGYDEIALTDHDGVEGLNEFMIAGKTIKIQVVSGIEFSTEFEGLEMHLLGYRFDYNNEALLAKTRELKTARHNRNVRLAETLGQMGYPIDLNELESVSKGAYVGKPDIARLMVKLGYINDVKEAFEEGRLLESPEIKAIKKDKMSTDEAIRLISEAGGTAVLAHPGKIKGLGERESSEFKENFETLIRKLKKIGLKGMECWYPEHSEKEVYFFTEIAGKYHLHMTEGSDFHGGDLK